MFVGSLIFFQQPDIEKTFESLAQSRIQAASGAYHARQYSKAIRLCLEITDAYATLPADARKRKAATIAGVYYSLACFACLNGEQDKASRFLETAVAMGFKDYRLMITDKDLSAMHIKGEFKRLLARVRPLGDYDYILRCSGAYRSETGTKPGFEYESAVDERLRRIREKYNLEGVAGDGNDLSKVLRLMRWVHLTVKQDGRIWPSVSMNADDLIAYTTRQHQGINCRCVAITLNDCYLAMGFKSRFVTCLPRDPNDTDCHVIDSVYMPSLNKWVWMDSSFGGYFKDEKGTLLGIDEVRDRIIHHKPMIASPELDYNGQPYPAAEYLNYMTKNLYWFSVALRSESDYETTAARKDLFYIHLLPAGYHPKMKLWPRREPFVTNLYTNDNSFFWQKP